MESERILITVRTYPQISSKYIETVCTGGINEKGEWRRLVPVPLRYLERERQFRTFDEIQIDLDPGKDGRPETRTPRLNTLKVIRHVEDWPVRIDWIKPTCLPSLKAMQDAGRTLAPVEVREVLEFTAKRTSEEWSAIQKEKLKQEDLFEERLPLEKLPYDFHFRWKDGDGDEHNSLIMAWEISQTWRQYRAKYEDPIATMREKWLNDLCGPRRSVSFFMGNLAKRRQVFGVCGVFSPPKGVSQDGLLW